MSTPIVQWPLGNNGEPTKAFSFGALKIWLSVTLPLMTITICLSLIIRWREAVDARKRREKLNRLSLGDALV